MTANAPDLSGAGRRRTARGELVRLVAPTGSTARALRRIGDAAERCCEDRKKATFRSLLPESSPEFSEQRYENYGVRRRGLEPLRLAALVPETSASAIPPPSLAGGAFYQGHFRCTSKTRHAPQNPVESRRLPAESRPQKSTRGAVARRPGAAIFRIMSLSAAERPYRTPTGGMVPGAQSPSRRGSHHRIDGRARSAESNTLQTTMAQPKPGEWVPARPEESCPS
jgi:hypothetical protein